MKTFTETLETEIKSAFARAGYDPAHGRVSLSNRPDLCEYQCNGAMAAAKAAQAAPLAIAEEVAEQLSESPCFSMAAAVKPGFINLNVREAYVAAYLHDMRQAEKFGFAPEKKQRTFLDYGGPNVAKPLHVGHLRSAIIGESIKRICRYGGDEVIADIHLGDWGLQMGLIITELSRRKPDLPYFDPKHAGAYPKEAPFTVKDLEEIYPTAAAKAKEDEAYYKEALEATGKLQAKDPGLTALWEHILRLSTADLKKNYDRLLVSFDLWKGESSVQGLIAPMAKALEEKGYAHFDDGALVVDVAEEKDTKEVPPCMILKSNGSALYTTTDLAAIWDREKSFSPDRIIYVVDKRQELHFAQVFRCAKKTGLAKGGTALIFKGFGTMNGKDKKPFKTREGGVMRLETLINEINETMRRKIAANPQLNHKEAEKTAEAVALSAIKYGDLCNQAEKDYVFDVDRFTSFEGNTGPYLLYTNVRIKSILRKAAESRETLQNSELLPAASASEKALNLTLARFPEMLAMAYEELSPHKICAFLYETTNAFNRFYHEVKILSEPNKEKRNGYLALLSLTERVLETGMGLLGFSSPERM